MTRCREKGCRRAPEYPDQAYCRDHQPKWRGPEWVARMQERRGVAKVFS